MSPRYDDDWVEKLLDKKSRLDGTKPEQFLATHGLRDGQTVVDYGCGPGFFTLPAAAIVGAAGKVYAVDIKQEMLDLVQERAAEAGHQNVSAVLNAGERVPLPDGVADYVLCVLVIHYAEDRAARAGIVTDIERLLKPDGHALFVDWDRGVRDGVEASELVGVLGKLDLEYDGPHPLGDKRYVVVGHKPRLTTPAHQ